MVEIPRLQAKRRFVMPAKTPSILKCAARSKKIWDSGLRRNDDREDRRPVDESEPIGFKPRVVQLAEPEDQSKWTMSGGGLCGFVREAGSD
jgi:hypothetical protein